MLRFYWSKKDLVRIAKCIKYIYQIKIDIKEILIFRNISDKGTLVWELGSLVAREHGSMVAR